jgi:hypothetical protein
MSSVYQSRMLESARRICPLLRLVAVMVLVGVGFALSGCAEMSDNMSLAFADPAKYDLYNCKQLEPERKNLAARAAELQGLMAKAETGTAGPVVAELAYRNDYIAVRGQAKLAEEAWRRNKCHESASDKTDTPAPQVAPSANARPAPRSRSGSAVY